MQDAADALLQRIKAKQADPADALLQRVKARSTIPDIPSYMSSGGMSALAGSDLKTATPEELARVSAPAPGDMTAGQLAGDVLRGIPRGAITGMSNVLQGLNLPVSALVTGKAETNPYFEPEAALSMLGLSEPPKTKLGEMTQGVGESAAPLLIGVASGGAATPVMVSGFSAQGAARGFIDAKERGGDYEAQVKNAFAQGTISFGAALVLSPHVLGPLAKAFAPVEAATQGVSKSIFGAIVRGGTEQVAVNTTASALSSEVHKYLGIATPEETRSFVDNFRAALATGALPDFIVGATFAGVGQAVANSRAKMSEQQRAIHDSVLAEERKQAEAAPAEDARVAAWDDLTRDLERTAQPAPESGQVNEPKPVEPTLETPNEGARQRLQADREQASIGEAWQRYRDTSTHYQTGGPLIEGIGKSGVPAGQRPHEIRRIAQQGGRGDQNVHPLSYASQPELRRMLDANIEAERPSVEAVFGSRGEKFVDAYQDLQRRALDPTNPESARANDQLRRLWDGLTDEQKATLKQEGSKRGINRPFSTPELSDALRERATGRQGPLGALGVRRQERMTPTLDYTAEHESMVPQDRTQSTPEAGAMLAEPPAPETGTPSSEVPPQYAVQRQGAADTPQTAAATVPQAEAAPTSPTTAQEPAGSTPAPEVSQVKPAAPDATQPVVVIVDTKKRPPKPETAVEKATRVVANDMQTWERVVRDELQGKGTPERKAPTYLGVEGTENQDPAYNALRQSFRASREHGRRSADYYVPTQKAVKDAGVTPDEFRQILYMQHAPEANALMRERNPNSTREDLSGWGDMTAEVLRKKWESDPRWEKIQPAIEKFRAMVDSNLEREVKAGLRSPEEAASLREQYDFYAPLKTNVEGQGTGTGRTGIRGRESQRQLGRTSQADDPFVMAIKQDMTTTARIESNRTLRSAARFVERFNDPEFAEVVPQEEFVKRGLVPRTQTFTDPGSGEEFKVRDQIAGDVRDIGFLDRSDAVAFKDGGKQYAIVFGKDYVPLAQALRGDSPIAQWARSTVGIQGFRQVAWFSRFTKRLTVKYNPFYWPVNFSKDTMETLARQWSEQGFQFAAREQANAAGLWAEHVAKTSVRNFGGSAFTSEAFGESSARPDIGTSRLERLRDRYHAAGGEMPSMGVESFDAIKADVEKFARKGDNVSALRRAIESESDNVENLHRLSVFDLMTRDGKMSDERAALAAAEANVNFSRKGQIAPVMEAFYPFYTASVNGTRALLNTARGKNFLQVGASMIAAGAALDMRNRAVAGVDENGVNRYDKLGPNNDDFVWMFSDGTYAKIPKPPGIGWLPNVGMYLSRLAAGVDNARRTSANVLGNLIEEASPIGSGYGSGEQNLLPLPANITAGAPALIRTGLDVYENRNYANRPIVPENRTGQAQKDNFERFHSYSNPLLRDATAWAHDASGGEVDIAPDAVEYLLKGYLPGVIQEATRAVSGVAKAVRGEKVDARDIPLWRRFYGEEDTRYTEGLFYDNVTLARTSKDAYDKLPESERAAFLKSHPEIRAIAPDPTGTNSSLFGMTESQISKAGDDEGAKRAAMARFNRQFRKWTKDAK